jgi:hypothetical protein
MPYDDRDNDIDIDISTRRSETGTNVPNYLVQSILVTLCCCVPLGIVAIVNAAQVNGHIAAGNYEAARNASEQARKWCTIGFFLGIVVNIIVIVVQVMAGLNQPPGRRF